MSKAISLGTGSTAVMETDHFLPLLLLGVWQPSTLLTCNLPVVRIAAFLAFFEGVQVLLNALCVTITVCRVCVY